MATQRSTLLSAINRMLRVIGESPATSTTSLPADGIDAKAVLDDVVRDVLSEGWHFNRDLEFPLTAAATAPFEIAIPPNAVSVQVSEQDYSHEDLIIRQGKIYNRDKHTFNMKDRTVLCDIIWLFDFEDLPQQLRRYVTIRAARVFASGEAPNILVEQLTADDEAVARSRWEAEDMRQEKPNMLRDNDLRQVLVREAG